jgi:hypothetical protein
LLFFVIQGSTSDKLPTAKEWETVNNGFFDIASLGVDVLGKIACK